MPRYLVSGLCLLALGGLALAETKATPTPTPRPRLSGGFGRPRATPVDAPSSDGGQSLADAVKAAQGTRTAGSTGEKSSVTINNKSLVKDEGKGRLSTASVSGLKPPAPTPTPASASHPTDASAGTAKGAAVPDSPMPAAGAGGGEAEWRETARKERKQVEDAKTRVAELNATSKKLENDFYAWDDGQYRDRVIKPAWDRAKQELEQAKIDLDAAEKQLADLPERARRAGALPGWIRE